MSFRIAQYCCINSFLNSTAMYYTILKSSIIYDHFTNLTYSNHLWSPCQISKYLKRYASDYFWLSIFGPCLRERDKASNKRNWRIKSSMLIITRKLAPSNIPLTINPTNLSAVTQSTRFITTNHFVLDFNHFLRVFIFLVWSNIEA